MSLRGRLTILSALVVVASLLTFTVITVGRTQAALEDRGDEELAVLASGLIGLARAQVQREADGRPPLRFRALEQLRVDGVFEGYGVVVQPDGSTLALPQLARSSEDRPDVPADLFDRRDGAAFDLPGPGGTGFRARVVSVPDTDAVMFLAVSTASLDATTADLVRVHVVTGAVLLLVFLVLAAVAVRVGLRPLTAVTRSATRIADGSTGERVPGGPPGTEIGELTTALNTMLGSLEAAVDAREQERVRTEQFAADAAHELRTPVAAILGYADLYRSGGIDPTEPDRLAEVFGRIGHEGERLRDLVESLLLLNRLDQGAEHLGGESDLEAVSAAAAADSMTIDHRHPIVIDTHGPAWAGVSPSHAFRIVANLLANVRLHTPPGTSTVITIGPDPDAPAERITLDVADDGPGIHPADRERVFDRFHRADSSRVRDTLGGGSGLGLAIVAALARAAGGDVRLVDAAAGGACFRVTLPAATPALTD